MNIMVRGVYDPQDQWSGWRILVDRLWLRGKKKEELRLDPWAKTIAPSNELRKQFDHRPEHFPVFLRAYRRELEQNPEAAVFLVEIARLLEQKPVTLLCAAKSREYNHALVLKEWILEHLPEAFAESEKDGKRDRQKSN